MGACRRYLALVALMGFCCFNFINSAAQEQMEFTVNNAREILKSRGEIIVRFIKPGSARMSELTKMISVDRVSGDTVTAYANESEYEQFLKLGISYEVLTPPSLKKGIFNELKAVPSDWRTRYLSYPEYLELMNSLASAYPDLCKLYEFGTSVGGRKLLALKISDNPSVTEQEPALMYSSTIHGDETVGYVLLLRLADYLLSNYATDQSIRELVNFAEIWINPLANPDGTYYVSNASVEGARRYNLNDQDLNRDFPDPDDGSVSGIRQPETTYMMTLMSQIHLVLSANFHGGIEVVNYPWDTWTKLHPDNDWYETISRAYANTAQANSPASYMDDLDNGITNGNAWYEIDGGRQDYANYYLRAREVTIELSYYHTPSESSLDDYWNYNKQSLLAYLTNAMTGVNGLITDSVTGQHIEAFVSLKDHDYDHSEILSWENDGTYYRMLLEGDYTLVFSKEGYKSKQISVHVTDGNMSTLNVRLAPLIIDNLYPNPSSGYLYFNLENAGEVLTIEIADLSGRIVKKNVSKVTISGIQVIDVSELSPGIYISRIIYGDMVFQQAVIKAQK